VGYGQEEKRFTDFAFDLTSVDALAGQCVKAAPHENKNILKILSKKRSLRFCTKLSYNFMYVPQIIAAPIIMNVLSSLIKSV